MDVSRGAFVSYDRSMSARRAFAQRRREVVSAFVLIVASVGACTVEDRVAVLRDAAMDADATVDASDAQMDAAVTNCPLPVTLPGATPTCSGALAASRFTFGLCACILTFDSDVSLRVDAFDSQSGPNVGGRLGSNAPTLLAGTTVVTGLMHVASGANDVAARVASAASENENVAIGLAPDALVALAADRTLSLPCGRYVLDAIGEVAPSTLTIDATGHVAIFVAGDVAVDRLVVTLGPGATLDLFVAGSLALTQDAPIGDPASPSALRIHVGGRGPIVFAGAPFAAHLFAPETSVTFTADQDVYGAIYAETLDAQAPLRVHQDLALGAEANGCAP
jgi:hypothetical protein